MSSTSMARERSRPALLSKHAPAHSAGQTRRGKSSPRSRALAARLSGLVVHLADPERLAEVGDWVIECGTGTELLARAERSARLS